ncbi:LysR family transcriptional regulator [Streptococcus gallolyticus]|uniref:LysR family transcriptional regulator n=1 Tax=Streptococcus gallolyticus TaxID=315405 RepID=UPI00228454D4|nr:LysR family transcriptional regulator [Streptococcus gallolyticus]MCY7190918.1 LysR family transcriptional regulator [Streptococcus gallolyticus subsp. gallolyticus]
METNIQKYLAFIKTVELGSFTKAAAALNYSQSGISRMINDLEEESGVSLLERNRSGINLTSDGINLLPFIEKMVNDYLNLERRMEELTDLETGIIRIGTFSSVATHWIPKMIQAFQKKYPRIEFELVLGDYSEIEKWINSGRVDFGFVKLSENRSLESTYLQKDELLVVLPENHPLTKYEKIPLKKFENIPFILLEKEENPEILELLNHADFSPNIQFRTWDDYAVMAMVEKNLGISILPELILTRVPYKIVTRSLEIPFYRRIGLVYKNKNVLSLAAREFLNYIDFR